MKKCIVLKLSVDEANTLAGLLDGSLGAADCEPFTKEMKPVLKRLDKAIKEREKAKEEVK